MDNKFLQFFNIVAFTATIIVNALAEILPLNGLYTSSISDSFPNLFVPAGYVFAIWGVIYAFLFGFVLYQARPQQRRAEFLGRISWLFIAASAANIVWIFVWHYLLILASLIATLGLLGSLILIYTRLGIGKTSVGRTERLLVHLPFSIYLGWVMVATVANVTALLVALGWNGLWISEVTWTIIILGVVVVLTSLVFYTRRDSAYALVAVWALVGIVIKQWVASPMVALSALACSGFIVAMLFLGALAQHSSQSHLEQGGSSSSP